MVLWDALEDPGLTRAAKSVLTRGHHLTMRLDNLEQTLVLADCEHCAGTSQLHLKRVTTSGLGGGSAIGVELLEPQLIESTSLGAGLFDRGEQAGRATRVDERVVARLRNEFVDVRPP